MATFPTTDSELNSFFQFVVAYLVKCVLRLGVSPDNITKMNECLVAWNIAYPLAIDKGTKTESTVKNKDIALLEMERILRNIFGDIPNSVLTALDRATLQIPINGGWHPPVPLPDSEPVGLVDAGNKLVHIISFTDSITKKKGKPHGVTGCELYSKIDGTEPVSLSEMTYVETLTNNTFTITYTGIQAGLKVWYWVRWIGKHEKGNWGAPFHGTIMPM